MWEIRARKSELGPPFKTATGIDFGMCFAQNINRYEDIPIQGAPEMGTKIYVDDDGRQYKTTIPKSLAESLGLEGGETIEWTIIGSDELKIQIKRE